MWAAASGNGLNDQRPRQPIAPQPTRPLARGSTVVSDLDRWKFGVLVSLDQNDVVGLRRQLQLLTQSKAKAVGAALTSGRLGSIK